MNPNRPNPNRPVYLKLRDQIAAAIIDATAAAVLLPADVPALAA